MSKTKEEIFNSISWLSTLTDKEKDDVKFILSFTMERAYGTEDHLYRSYICVPYKSNNLFPKNILNSYTQRYDGNNFIFILLHSLQKISSLLNKWDEKYKPSLLKTKELGVLTFGLGCQISLPSGVVDEEIQNILTTMVLEKVKRCEKVLLNKDYYIAKCEEFYSPLIKRSNG